MQNKNNEIKQIENKIKQIENKIKQKYDIIESFIGKRIKIWNKKSI